MRVERFLKTVVAVTFLVAMAAIASSTTNIITESGITTTGSLDVAGAMNLSGRALTQTYSCIVAQDGTGDYSDIQSCIDAVSAGGKIYVKNGTYNTASQINISKSLTIECSGWGTLINYTGSHLELDPLVIIEDEVANGTVIRNCKFDVNNNTENIIQSKGNDDIVIEDNYFVDGQKNGGIVRVTSSSSRVASRIRIINNNFDLDNKALAILVTQGAEDFVISGNVINEPYDSCISVGSSTVGMFTEHGTISNNVCRKTRSGIGFGIDLYGNITDITITGNTIKNTGGSDCISMHTVVSTAKPTFVTITGNTLQGCPQEGIELDCSGGYCVVTSNIIHDVGDKGIEITGGSSIVAFNSFSNVSTPINDLTNTNIIFANYGYTESVLYDNSFSYLNVSGGLNVSGVISVGTVSSTSSAGASIEVDEITPAQGNVYITFGEGGTKRWSVGNDASPNNAFTISTGGDLTSEKLTILTTGEVGIGTTSPTSELHVSGDENITGTSYSSKVDTHDIAVKSSATSGIAVNIEPDSLVEGAGLVVDSNSASLSGAYYGGLVLFKVDNPSATGDVFLFRQDGSGKVGTIDQNGDNVALRIDSESATYSALDIMDTPSNKAIQIASGDKLCLDGSACTQAIYYNGSGIVIGG